MESKVLAALKSLTQPRFKILAYHGIPKRPSNLYEVGVEAFEAQMQLIADKGVTVIDLRDAVERMRTGTLSPKIVVITFDDAHTNIFENAIPILTRFKYPATIFVPTGLTGKHDVFSDRNAVGHDIMTWTHLKEICDNGFFTGSHSVNHYNLNDLDQNSLRYEINASHAALTQNIGDIEYFFAYPYGMLNANVRRTVAESKFIGALCFGSVLSNWAETDIYQLKREKILSTTKEKEFVKIIDPQYDFSRAAVAHLLKTIKKTRRR